MSEAISRYICMPGYGHQTPWAGKGFWRATRRTDVGICHRSFVGSLLAANFNQHWVESLNFARHGHPMDYFAMQHADVEPEDWWLDKLIDEMEAHNLDILGVAVPIKDTLGLTSTALARTDGDNWRPLCRLSMTDIYRLPATFTSADVGHPILLNTGLWACRFRESWASQVQFRINDRIVRLPDGSYANQCEPEDWYFSRLCHEIGLRIGCTRKIKVTHRGEMAFPNTHPWGDHHDAAYVSASPVATTAPHGYRLPAIDGWLRPEEGAALEELASGKTVLEIGAYLGLSTVCLARTARRVTSIDPHDGRMTPAPQDTYDQFIGHLVDHDVDRYVTPLIGTFEEYAETLVPGRFDLIFIDGDHRYDAVRQDIRMALPLLAPGGLLAFHDYLSDCDPGVTQAVNSLISYGGEIVSLTGHLVVVRVPTFATSRSSTVDDECDSVSHVAIPIGV